MSGDLIDTTEMYLKTVFELREAGIAPMRARIAERLDHSGPTVSQTVARMERDGLLHLDEERRIRLTPEGVDIATAVMRKHRLAERHLLDTIGLEYALVHEEACRWEHVMSLEVEKRIAALIEPPYLDPYGNPIPGLAELGIEGEAIAGDAVPGSALTACSDLDLADGPVRARLARIGEWAQSDPEILRDLERHGLVAGAQVTVDRIGTETRLAAEGHEPLIVGRDIVAQLVLEVAPSA